MKTPAFLALLLTLFLASNLRATEVISPSELEVGEEGYFITEVEGGELLRSPIRVLGVIEATMPSREIVLIRLMASRFIKTGVAAGMSGSPVYIRGRLLGALAFAWSFASEPIAGVTPFINMEADLELEQPAEGGVGNLPEGVALAEAVSDETLPGFMADWWASLVSETQDSLPLNLSAGGLLSGYKPDGWLGEVLHGMSWRLAPAGGHAESSVSKGGISPGSMIAAILVKGDAHIAAGGTVTEIRGDQVWAFGHPFLRAGSIKMPMARASVVTILPSLENSFKVFNTGAEIGTFYSDRSHGIWGRLGPRPRMIPLHFESGGESYDFGILPHRVMTPLLTAYLIQGIQAVRREALSFQSVSATLGIRFDDGRYLQLNQSFEGVDAQAQVAAWSSAVTGFLMQNTYAAPDIEQISCRLEGLRGLHRRRILDVIPSARRVLAGETVQLQLRLLAADGGIETRVISLEIPRDAAPGKLNLVVADGASWAAYDLKTRPMLLQSFGGLLRMLHRLRSARTIVAAIEGAGRNLVTTSGSVPLPAGVLMNLRSARQTQVQTVAWRVMTQVEETTEFPVLGALRMKLELMPSGFEKGVTP